MFAFATSTLAFSATAAAPAALAQQGLAAGMGRMLRPQAAYRWLLPQLGAITPQYIEMILRGALMGGHVQQWELFSLMEDTSPRLGKNLDQIKNAVQGMKAVFTPYADDGEEPSDEAKMRAAVCSAAFRGMKPDAAADENAFAGTVFDLLDAWGKGVSVLETEWQMSSTPKLGDFCAPRCTAWVHPSAYGWDADGRIKMRTTGTALAEFPADKFLIAVNKARSGSPLGGARLRTLAWWWCAANFSADWMLNHAQLFGVPFRWANYDPNLPADLKAEIGAMLQNMGSTGYAYFPTGTSMEFLEAGHGGGSSPQEGILDRFDKICDLLILGQTLTSDMGKGGGGSLALGKVHEGVKEEVVTAAARFAAEVFNEQLFPSILRLTFGDEEACPSVSFETEQEDDLVKKSTILATLATAGAGSIIGLDWLGKTFDIPKPGAGEKTLADGQPSATPPPDGSTKGTKDTKGAKPGEAVAAPDPSAPVAAREFTRLAQILEIADDAVRAKELTDFAESLA